MRPLCALRNLVRFGCSIFVYAFSVRRRTVAIAPATVTAVVPLATLTALARTTAFSGATLVSGRIVLKDFALEDPHLDADDAIGRLGFGGTVVDVGAQRVQRHATFAVPLGASDVGAAETAAHIHPDAAGAHTDRRLHCTLHRTAERHATLELLGNALCDEVRIGLGLAHLDD